MEQITVTVNEAKQQLRLAIQQYLQKDEQGRYRFDRRHARPVCLMGPAGVGKTELVEQVAREEDLAFLSYSITHHTRQSLLGLPTITRRQENGRELTATEYTVSELFDAMEREMVRTGKQEGVLFLDEFNSASPTIQPVLLQLLQSKQLGTHIMPEGWMVVAAGNPVRYNSSASSLDAVTADRMRMLWLQPSFAEWVQYMNRKGGHPMVVAYLTQKEEHFFCSEKQDGVPLVVTPRAWDDLSQLLQFYESRGEKVTNAAIAQVIQHPKIVREFGAFYRKHGQAAIRQTIQTLLRQEMPPMEQLEGLPPKEQWALSAALLETCHKLFRTAAEQEQEANQIYDLLKKACAEEDPMRYLQSVQDEMTEPQLKLLERYLTDHASDLRGRQLKQLFAREVVDRRDAALQKASGFLERCIQLLQQLDPSGPQMEYFLGGITQHPACQQMLPQGETPLFMKVAGKLYGKAPKGPARTRKTAGA